MIDIQSHKFEGITIVEISGKLNTGASPEAESYIMALIADGANQFVLNLRDLDMISSTGLRVILASGKKLASSGGKLVICQPNHTVSDVLKMSGFNMMFQVFDTEDEALASFG